MQDERKIGEHMRICILDFLFIIITILVSPHMVRSAELAGTNEDLHVFLDYSSLPHWQQDELRSYDISARVILRKDLKTIDDLLFFENRLAASDQERDVYIVVGIRKTSAPSRRILCLHGLFREPENLRGLEVELRSVSFGKDERDVTAIKLYGHDESRASAICANIERKILVITSCTIK